MREKDIEEYLRKEVKKAGGKAYKFESPGNDGVPDRIVIFPGNNIYFIELKAPGKKPRPLQLKQMRDLKNFNCSVSVMDSKEQVDRFIDFITRTVFSSEEDDESEI
ncbi:MULTISPECIES: VRR-NUC domain-containing protein [unclassified Oceanobacillus]|uniref:VRR-NUC domain-containing protein n=1 Tax=unclassified Oceanobacillus TaxID=2630292 RepID=UPI001BEA4B8B|nr:MULTISPECIES: VRR-NUC domain-containing protein [unclassified Oceanobacillus]MBT2599104.1 VRR-NUC domain-containing protein [Oceanobacillus sp. ISL-74]MBT2652022.1 VRR-NUC domain-containing protein [Oceanobacillus sp. ISL-73]